MSVTRMPAIFFGHGNPMNSISDNRWTRAWRALGEILAAFHPRAIVCVSAHWYVRDTRLTAMEAPPTIHDFGGFPRELYEVQYPAPGDPALAARVAELLAPLPVALDAETWGLDHGTWSVLRHVFPRADVPVVQISIDRTRPGPFHYDLGRRLAPLRDEGILLVASGNLVHNLHAYAWGVHLEEPYDWAGRFEVEARRLLLSGDHGPLVAWDTLGPEANLAIPTPDHYLPLLYVLGASRPGDEVSFPVEGFDGGSMSMVAVRLG